MSRDDYDYSAEDEAADLRAEFATERPYRCSDRMCGADDCERCRPGCTEQQEGAEDE